MMDYLWLIFGILIIGFFAGLFRFILFGLILIAKIPILLIKGIIYLISQIMEKAF